MLAPFCILLWFGDHPKFYKFEPFLKWWSIASMWYVCFAINDLLDLSFFDPYKFNVNEYVTFVAAILLTYPLIKKWNHLKKQRHL